MRVFSKNQEAFSFVEIGKKFEKILFKKRRERSLLHIARA